jgi:hypothetical protein
VERAAEKRWEGGERRGERTGIMTKSISVAECSASQGIWIMHVSALSAKEIKMDGK